MSSKQKTTKAGVPKRILFIHPDLGIGGAERLVVDAAVGLQDRGHSVTIYTSHCDPRHCFDEARNGTYRFRSRVADMRSCTREIAANFIVQALSRSTSPAIQ